MGSSGCGGTVPVSVVLFLRSRRDFSRRRWYHVYFRSKWLMLRMVIFLSSLPLYGVLSWKKIRACIGTSSLYRASVGIHVDRICLCNTSFLRSDCCSCCLVLGISVGPEGLEEWSEGLEDAFGLSVVVVVGLACAEEARGLTDKSGPSVI